MDKLQRVGAQNKWFVDSGKAAYSKEGKYLGTFIVVAESFTDEELKPLQCIECGGPNGFHREYFIKTGQTGGGEVHGFFKKCSQMGGK